MTEEKDFISKLQERRKLIIGIFATGFAAFVFSGIESVILLSIVTGDLLLTRALTKINISFVGIELATLGTLVAGFMYGSVAGAFTGGSIVLLRSLTSGIIGPFLLWKLPGFILLGLFSGIIDGSYHRLGILLAVGMRTVFLGFTYLVMKSKVFENLMFGLSSIYITDYLLRRIIELNYF